MSKNTFADRLREAMKASGFTQGSLAKMVGMSQSSIWKLTSGAASGSRKTVELAKALNVRPEWLASGELPSRTATQISCLWMLIVPYLQAYTGSICLMSRLVPVPGSFLSSEFIETIRAIEFTEEHARVMFGNRPASSIK